MGGGKTRKVSVALGLKLDRRLTLADDRDFFLRWRENAKVRAIAQEVSTYGQATFWSGLSWSGRCGTGRWHRGMRSKRCAMAGTWKKTKMS